jgi:putative membrane protein
MSEATQNQPVKKGGSATDHLANERTFLAWIRTAIAIMAFGFVVVKFSLFVKQIALMATDKSVVLPDQGTSSTIGIFLVALGAIMSLLAFIRYKGIERQLNQNLFFPSVTLVLLLTLSILAGSILLVIYLLPNL